MAGTPHQMHTTTSTQRPADYWASLPADELANEMSSRIDRWYYYILTSGRLETWNRSHRMHHQGIMDFGRIRIGGLAGEQTLLKVNHLRNITSHVVNLITSQRPAFDVKAANADYDSEAQCQFAQALLDYDLREKRLEDVARKCVDYAIKYGESYALKVWDANEGEVIAVNPETNRPIHVGTLKFMSKMPSEVIRDYSSDDYKRNDWFIVREWINRYEVASRFDPETEQEQYDACLNAPNKIEAIAIHPEIGVLQGGPGVSFDFRIFENSDDIEVFTLWHNRTSAMPAGRRTQIVGTTVLDDGPLPYERAPVFRIAAGDQDGVSFGYTQVYDSLSVQHMINHLYAAAASNNASFAMQSILRPIGQPISVKQVAGGMAEIEYDPSIGKPEALQLTHTAPETYAFLKMLVQDLQTNLGVNDVIRGNPETSLKSGAALAMVASQALQFLVNMQAEYVHFLEDIATGAIEDYKRFASIPRVITIAGKGNRAYTRSFTKDDLTGVNKVLVDIGNPLSKTIAGRMELAQQLITMPPQDRADFIEVMSTGRLEPVIEGDLQENLTIKSENENLTEGKPVIPLVTDNHASHISKHKSVMGSPEARENQQIAAAVLDHISEHISMYQNLSSNNPALLILTGQTPLPPGPLNPAAMPPPGPPASKGPMGPAGNPAGKMPQMPQMPINPQSGQREQGEVPGVPPPGVGE